MLWMEVVCPRCDGGRGRERIEVTMVDAMRPL